MTAGSLVSNIVQPLRLTDTGIFAIDQMSEFKVRHLPIIKEGQLLGLVSEEDILNFDIENTLSSFQLHPNRTSVSIDKHIYDILKLMVDFQLTAIPVRGKDNQYIGTIIQEDVLNVLGNMGAFTLPGSVVVLEMNRIDYSLAKISSIVEQENASVISAFISSSLENNQAEVTLKINKKNVLRIVSSFQRHGYIVKASYHESDQVNDALRDRFDSFMVYLNV